MAPGNPENRRWTMQIPNRTPVLMRALEELEGILAGWEVPDDARYHAQLAIEEFGTNIIKYGYDDVGEHSFDLRVCLEGRELHLELEDDGHEFNPILAPEPDPDLPLQERKPGGWGISLLRRLLAKLEYERRDGRNVLRMTIALGGTQ